MLAGDAITLAGRSCRPSCADWSACTPYLPYGVHAKFMSVPSSSWLTSGKPPPVAYACGTVRYVRFGHDFSQESPLCLQPVMISGMSCVCAPRLGEVGRSGFRRHAWRRQGRKDDLPCKLPMGNSVQFVIGASPDIAAALCAAAMSAQLQCQVSCRGHACGSDLKARSVLQS